MEHKNPSQTSDPSQTRRHFFGWARKIASGAALAGVGLGLTNTPSAFATTQNKNAAILASSLKRKPAASPDSCIDCTGCSLDGCTYDTTDCTDPSYPFLIEWEVDSGCAPHCTVNVYFACATCCYSPCTGQCA